MGLRAGENRYWELIVGKMGGDCSAKESLVLGVWHFPSGLKVVPSSWIRTYFRYISTHSTIVARCTPAPSLLSQSNPWVSQWTEQSTVSKRASGNVHHIISNVQPLGNQVHRLPDASTTKYRTYILPHFQGYGLSKKRRRRPFFRGLRLMRLRGESQFDQTYMNASTDHVQFNPPTRHGLVTLIHRCKTISSTLDSPGALYVCTLPLQTRTQIDIPTYKHFDNPHNPYEFIHAYYMT